MKEQISAACAILSKVFSEGTYADRAFDNEDPAALTSRLVFGVLEKNVEIEYILLQLVEKNPKKFVHILLKVGIYALRYLDNVPDYAIVSECVEAAKSAGKGGAAGFVNAVLKRVAKREYRLPDPSDAEYLSVHYCVPQWFVDKLTVEYGKDVALDVLSARGTDEVHLRVNRRMSNLRAVEETLKKKGQEYSESEVGGLLTRVTPVVKQLFAQGVVTYQSPSSVLAVDALAPQGDVEILDLCSAPGGKAVYASELAPKGRVTACDLHPHRVALIKKYAERMHADNVKAVCADATVFDESLQNKFDFVMADVPCSCFGTYKKHPDVFLQRGEKVIPELASVQRKIISNAARYLKRGGVLVYSTCTLFSEENEDNARYAQSLGLVPDRMPINHPNDGTLRIMPHGEWDGFFIARFEKK